MAARVGELTGEYNTTLPHWLVNPDPTVYLNAPWLMMDVETTNLEKGNALNPDNRLVCAAWCTRDNLDIRYKKGNEFEQHELVADIKRVLAAGGFIIAHNAKFECHWLSRMGISLYDLLTYDTMIGEYVLGGNRWQYMHLSLDKVNKKYHGTGKAKIIDALMKGGVCPSKMPEHLLEARVRKDVADLAEIFYYQRQRLKERNQLAVAFTRNILTPCLTSIEQKGVGLNKERVYEEYQAAYDELAAVQVEIDKMMKGGNWRSPDQKAAFIYDELKFKELTKRGKPVRTPSGKRCTDQDTLEALKATNKRQRQFIALIKRAGSANAALTKNLEFFKGIIDEYDGVFYGQFNQCATQTQRLSSSGLKKLMAQFTTAQGKPKEKSVQFQNFPRRFKDLMQPKRKGWLMGECDGSQLEFRGAAYLGQDAMAMADIRGDVDIHRYTASVINSVPEDEVTKLMRQDAKPDTFGPLYGKQNGTPGQVAYFQAFRDKYSDLFEVQTGWTHEVLQTKKLVTEWGLTYFWPHTRMSQSGYIDNTTNIFNYPIQAFSTAEIIPIALVYLWHRMHVNEMESEMVNTVHDSAICEVKPSEADLWKRLSLQTFTVDVYEYLDTVYDVQFNVPLGAGISLGERWSSKDTRESEINVEPDGEFWFKGTRLDPDDTSSEDAWHAISGMAA